MNREPVISKWILSVTNRQRNREDVIGDFSEIYENILNSKSKKKADAWYRKQAMVSIPKFLTTSIYWGGSMFRNYLKIAIRNLVKHKSYSALNIIGLATGMACSIMIMLWVFHEISFDKFHSKSDRIYRVLQNIKYDEVVTWAINQGPLAPALKEDIPEIEDYTRVCYGSWRVTYHDKTLSRVGLYVDPGFFNMFDFKMLKGDPKLLKDNPHTVILCETYAHDIFGDEDPIGKVINLYEMYDVKVVGVIQDSPDNSHLKFNFISNLTFAKEIGYTVDGWKSSAFMAYLLLRKGTDVSAVESKIYNFLDDKPTLEEWEKLTLQPLFDIHFSPGIGFDQSITIDKQYVIIFAIAAIFILLIASINFINLSTARSELRAKEIGLRKVIGAGRGQLVKQFMGESVLLTFISSMFGLAIVIILLPYFNDISGKHFTISYIFSSEIISRLLLIMAFTAFAAGLYPAFLLSSVRPVSILKGVSSSGRRSILLRKTLVIFQFVVSSFLIIGTIVVFMQLNLLRNKPLGYDKDNLIYFYISGKHSDKYETLKNELLENKNILNVCRSSTIPYYGITFSNAKWVWEGSNRENSDLIRATYIDENYFNTYKINMVEGRGFSKDYLSDSSAIVINETTAKLIGFENPVGKTIYYANENENIPLTIIGVCKDYNFQSLRSKVEPLIHLYASSDLYGISVRLNSEHTSKTLSYIDKTLKSVISGSVFDYSFLNETLDRLYRTEERIGDILTGSAILAILISALGLLGLASFTVTKRRKEIGVRKVLGANIGQIITVLIKDYSQWILIGNALACPLSYYLMKTWLNNFPYRAEISFLIFPVTIMITFIIALLSVICQTVKAALQNPTESLKYE